MGVVMGAVVIAFFIFVAGFIVYSIINEMQIQQALRKSGITTDAEIIDKDSRTETKKDSNGFTHTERHFYFTYRYMVNGIPYTSQEGVRRSVYENKQVGNSIAVVYLPEEPKTVRMADEL